MGACFEAGGDAMNPDEKNDFDEIMKEIQTWEPSRRLTLARRILDTLEASVTATSSTPPVPRGRPAAEILADMKTDRPAPDDETVRQWIDEHRMEKYGR
jgi:hypothetical protein